MLEQYLPQIIGLASGAVGGNLVGHLMKSGMGTLGRSLTGIVGGTGLSFLAPMIPGLSGMFPAPGEGSGVVGGLLSGTVGGGLLTAILGMFKK